MTLQPTSAQLEVELAQARKVIADQARALNETTTELHRLRVERGLAELKHALVIETVELHTAPELSDELGALTTTHEGSP